jgi:hypothetical protein
MYQSELYHRHFDIDELCHKPDNYNFGMHYIELEFRLKGILGIQSPFSRTPLRPQLQIPLRGRRNADQAEPD